MGKKLVVFEGSPRRKGNSCVLAAHAAQAARGLGAEVEVFHLQGMKISPCNHCDGCLRKGVYCTLQDDMQTIYPSLQAADGVLLASPIYWFNYSAQLKTCIDRWYGLWNQDNHFLRGKPVGIILAFGDEDVYTSGGINAVHTFETMFRYLEAPIAGWVYGSLSDVGDAQKNPALLEKAEWLGRQLIEQIGG